MVTSSKDKEENTIYMMSSVTENIFLMLLMAKDNLETMIVMVVESRKEGIK